MGNEQLHTTFILHIAKVALTHGIVETISDHLDISCDEMVFNTGSKVVLCYTRNRTKRFYVYVSNHVEKIIRISEPKQGIYVRSNLNPVGIATRTCSLSTNQSNLSLWLQEPKYLHVDDCNSDEHFDLVSPEEDKEIRSDITVVKTNYEKCSVLDSDYFSKFCQWNRLISAFSPLKHIAAHWSGTKPVKCHKWHKCTET